MAANVQPMKRAAKRETIAAHKPTRRKELLLRKILVPVDFSECSKKALEYAISFAGQFKAGLLILHVLEPYMPGPEVTTVDVALMQAESRDYSERELHNLQKSIETESGCTTMLREGKAHRVIVDVAREAGVDLIIIATHSRTGFSRLVLGSTTERVVRQASCPVLVVREKEHDFLTDAPPTCLQDQPGG